MAGLLTKMVIFVALMCTGYLFARREDPSGGFTRAASSLVINVFMSATIINSVASAQLEASWGQLGQIMLVDCAAIGLGYLLAALAARLLPVEEKRRAGFELMMAVPNNMFIALPVLDQLYGPAAVFYCGLSNIPFNLVLYTYGMWRLKKGEGGERFRLRQMLSAPLISTLVAVVLFLTRLQVPALLQELLNTMSGATMPLSMIVIGASLSSVSLLDAFRRGRFYLSALVKLLLAPVLVWAVCGLLTADPVLRATGTLIAASPSGVIVTVLTVKNGGDAVFTSEGILHSTVLAMGTIPLLVYLLL